MKSCVFALMMVAVIPFISTDADCATKVYKRVSTTKKATTPTFYYNQSNRRKYSVPVEARQVERVVVQQPVVTMEEDVVEPVTYIERPQVDSYVAESYSEKKQVQKQTKVSQERKYFLAHPFFQPLRNSMGSITDVSSARNSFHFDMLNSVVYKLDENGNPQELEQLALNLGGRAETSQFVIKQDFSFGLTDKLAVIAMGQYDSTELALKDWTGVGVGEPEVKNSSSGLNVFGFGLQLRFLDITDAIGMLSVAYESQKDTTDSVLADLKLGYKLDRTTLYLVGRGGYSSLKNKESSYGVYLEDGTGDYILLSYKRNVSDLFYGEGGFGFFSVLNKYFTFNAEALFGTYDWHNKLTGRVEFGIQPSDSVALSVYVSGTLYDSANGQQKEFERQDVNPESYPSEPVVWDIGNYKLKDYNEYRIGGRLILHF